MNLLFNRMVVLECWLFFDRLVPNYLQVFCRIMFLADYVSRIMFLVSSSSVFSVNEKSKFCLSHTSRKISFCVLISNACLEQAKYSPVILIWQSQKFSRSAENKTRFKFVILIIINQVRNFCQEVQNMIKLIYSLKKFSHLKRNLS